MSDLKKIYQDEIVPKLKDELGLGNIMEVPKITKITQIKMMKITYTKIITNPPRSPNQV